MVSKLIYPLLIFYRYQHQLLGVNHLFIYDDGHLATIKSYRSNT